MKWNHPIISLPAIEKAVCSRLQQVTVRSYLETEPSVPRSGRGSMTRLVVIRGYTNCLESMRLDTHGSPQVTCVYRPPLPISTDRTGRRFRELPSASLPLVHDLRAAKIQLQSGCGFSRDDVRELCSWARLRRSSASSEMQNAGRPHRS